jgi:hypothetical protein
LLAAKEAIRLGHQSAHDLKLFATTIKESQQSLVMQLTALELEDAGEKESAATLVSQSEVIQARSDKGFSLSVLYSDPRYAPAEPGGLPNEKAYLEDLSKAVNEFVAKQNTASDEYHNWDNKADAYIAVLSILAIAFFLLGLAQSTGRLRLFFAISALAVMVIAAVWTGFIMVA